MNTRIELQRELEKILGSKNVYFQPPGTFKVNYPCIVYKRDRGRSIYADNRTYNYRQAYQITYIDKNPDNNVIENLIEHFPMISYNRHFVAENLNHDVLILYY